MHYASTVYPRAFNILETSSLLYRRSHYVFGYNNYYLMVKTEKNEIFMKTLLQKQLLELGSSSGNGQAIQLEGPPVYKSNNVTQCRKTSLTMNLYTTFLKLSGRWWMKDVNEGERSDCRGILRVGKVVTLQLTSRG